MRVFSARWQISILMLTILFFSFFSSISSSLAVRLSQNGGKRGRVSYVSSDHVYLNQGKLDGIRIGDRLEFFRGRGSCQVDRVSDHYASCVGARVKPGDTFVAKHPPTIEKPSIGAAGRILSQRELDRRLNRVVSSDYNLVDYRGSTAWLARLRTPMRVSLSHQTWETVDREAFNAERIDFVLNRTDTTREGLAAGARATMIGYTQRPDTARFRPNDDLQFYLWEGSLTYRDRSTSTAYAVGRLWPWFTPGFVVLDGAQIGWRNPQRPFYEIGLFGGTQPDIITLSPDLNRWAAGAYAALTQRIGRLDIRHQVRLGARNIPNIDVRYEGELQSQVWFADRFDFNFDIVAGLGQGFAETVTGLRADLGIKPFKALSLRGGFRLQDADNITDELFYDPFLAGRAIDGDGRLELQTTSWLWFRANAGYSEQAGLQERDFYGPEIVFPRAFGEQSGITVGYERESGWIAGRAVYSQIDTITRRGIDAFFRASYFENDQDFNNQPYKELGFNTSLRVPIVRWIKLRTNFMVRLDITNDPLLEQGPRQSGFIGSVTLTGNF